MLWPDSSSDEAQGSAGDANSSSESAPSKETKQARCWDGTKVKSLRQCPDPVGVAGAKWVFPNFNETKCPLVAVVPARRFWLCSTNDTPSGQTADIRYSWWRDADAATFHYENKERPGSTQRKDFRGDNGRVFRTVWRYPGVDRGGQVTLSAMYAGLPYSMSVDAATAEDRDAVFASQVEFRTPEDLRGRPAVD